MRLAGFILLLAGWTIDLTALAVLNARPQTIAFMLAGAAVEVLGLVLVIRSHLHVRGAQS